MPGTANSLARRAPSARARAGGVIAVEFVLVLIAALFFFMPVAEFMRLSLFDQVLAAATHQAARAAAAEPNNADPGKCLQAVDDAFQANRLASWLLDQNDDGAVGVAANAAWPSGGDDVFVSLLADEDLYDGDEWEVAGACGASGSWIKLETRIVVQPWSGLVRALWPDGVRRQRQSWARNQA